MRLDEWRSEDTDDDPGDAPLEGHLAFEEWADPDDQHTAVVLSGTVSSHGRVLVPGDVVTPRYARQEALRWAPAGTYPEAAAMAAHLRAHGTVR